MNSTKQHLNAGRGHQANRKAAHCLQKKAAKNIKDKKRDKRVRDRPPFWERVIKDNSETPGNILTSGSVGSFRISDSNMTRKKNK